MSNAAASSSSTTTTTTSSTATVIQDGIQMQVPMEVPVLTGVRNGRGIPQVMFMEDVGAYLEAQKAGVDTLLLSFTTMMSKYKLMEQSHTENKKRLKIQIPDIEASLAAVKMLQKKKEDNDGPFQTRYNIADQIYAPAEVAPVGTVNLWLGANVMLEYTYEEAIALLEVNLKNAKLKFEEVGEDLEYLKDQITTTQVNTARIYNYDIVKRREDAKKAGASALTAVDNAMNAALGPKA